MQQLGLDPRYPGNNILTGLGIKSSRAVYSPGDGIQAEYYAMAELRAHLNRRLLGSAGIHRLPVLQKLSEDGTSRILRRDDLGRWSRYLV